MLFDIGWPELMLIGIVALVVIGPKDLPRALRVAGFWVRKARTLSREFQGSIDQMIREAELNEVREELKKASEFNLEAEVRSAIDPTGELAESIRPPDVPDFFQEAEGPETASGEPPPEPLPEPPTELLPALAAPAEAPLPEQPTLPFDMPEPAPSGSAPEPSNAAAAAVPPAGPARTAEPAPAKP